MEELLVVLKDLDLKVLAMGGIVFLLTLFLKMPIKRATARLIIKNWLVFYKEITTKILG